MENIKPTDTPPLGISKKLYMYDWGHFDIFAILIGLSSLIYLEVSIFSTDKTVNLSLFEPVTLLSLFWVMRENFFNFKNFKVILLAGLIFLLVIFSHFFTMVYQFETLKLVGLLKESLKLILFFLETFLLSLVFIRSKMIKNVSFTAFFLLASIAVGSYLEWSELKYGTLAYETLLCSLLTTWFFIFSFNFFKDPRNTWFLGWKLDLPKRVGLYGFFLLLTLFGAYALGSKVYAALVVMMGLSFYYKDILILLKIKFPKINISWNILGGSLFLFLGLIFRFSAMIRANLLDSLNPRLEIWNAALTSAFDFFPLGIGLGQFVFHSERFPMNPIIHYAHNTPLGLFMEMGALGALLFIVFSFYIFKISQIFKELRWLFLLTVFSPMLFHDVLGLKGFIILLAFGISQYHSSSFEKALKY